jgi:deoxyribonuclease-4
MFCRNIIKVITMPVFGVARIYGNDINSFLQKLQENSVEAYEIGFANGVYDDLPEETVILAEALRIRLSGHMPFFISWLSEEKVQNSVKHFLKGINFAVRLRTLVICHLGYYGGKSFEELKPVVVKGISEAIKMAEENYNVAGPFIGIETTGKGCEIGSLDEVLSIVNELSVNAVVPVIDWAHLFARSNGEFPRKIDDFRTVLSRLEEEVGLKNFYFHASGIDYKNGNERKHISVKTCRPPLPYLFATLNEVGYDYTIIVESPEQQQIEDLIWLKEVSKNPESWFSFVQKQVSLLGHQTQLVL